MLMVVSPRHNLRCISSTQRWEATKIDPDIKGGLIDLLHEMRKQSFTDSKLIRGILETKTDVMG
jgi:hypothetical protein